MWERLYAVIWISQPSKSRRKDPLHFGEWAVVCGTALALK
jgi:hypothetical protein